MAATEKVTFTVDRETVRRLERAAARTGKPKSQVVREAIADYHDRLGRLSESERLRLLKLFDELVPAIPSRPQSGTDRELQEIRQARRRGGRRRSTRR